MPSPASSSALALNPDYAQALHNLGLCHHKRRELDRAETCYRRALAVAPDHHAAHIDLGNVCLDRNDPEGMVAWYRRALAFTPEDAAACVNVGRMLRDLGRLDEALTLYEAALRLDPDNVESHFSRGLIRLTQGRYPDGWQGYEWRCRRAEWVKGYPHRLSSPRWNGEPFGGRTLLVHHEQGFGDTLQFVRYLPMAKARGGRVLFEVPAALRSLVRGVAGADDVLELSPDGPTRVPHDLHVPLLSLPGLCGTTLDTIPAEVPYLFADPVKTAAWAERLDPLGLNIGIVWSGSTWTRRLAEKSCPVDPLMGLTTIPGTRWVALQKDAPAAEFAAARAAGVACWGPEFRDFSDTAAAVVGLDLVIAVDTAVAHLAGAMGKPVWVLLPQRCGLALAARPHGQPLVPDHAPLPAEAARQLGGCDRAGCARPRRCGPRTGGDAMTLPVDDPAAIAPWPAGTDPGVEDWFRRANRSFMQRDYPDALACYRRAIALAPETPELHFNLGNTFLELKSWDEAVVCFQRTLSLSPGFTDAHVNLGIAHYELKSIEARSRPTARRPNWPRTARTSSTTSASPARKPAAATRPSTATAGPSTLARISWRHTTTWGMRCRRPESSRRPRTPTAMALAHRPDYADAHYNLGRLRHLQHRLPEAIAVLRRGAPPSPRPPPRRATTPARPTRTRGGSMPPSRGTAGP